MGLTIPPTIEEELVRIDRDGAECGELTVHQALASARTLLSNPGEQENLGAWSEVLAFALMPNRQRSGPWGTYFGPIGSGTNTDRTIWYSPDIKDAVPEVIEHWAA